MRVQEQYVDARPFMTVGVAASHLGYCRKSSFVVGVLLAATSKNPFIDVHYNYHVMNMSRVVDSARKNYIITRQFGLDYRFHSTRKFTKSGKDEKEE